MMKIKYDRDVDAKYVSIKKGKVFDTKVLTDWLFYDVNKNGEVLGVEVLDFSKHDVTIATDGSNVSITESVGLANENKTYDFEKDSKDMILQKEEFTTA